MLNHKLNMEFNGKMDWKRSFRDDQASKVKLVDKLSCTVVKNTPERTFLILVKRIKQGEWLAKEIEKECFNHVDRLLNNLSIDDEQKEHKHVATLLGLIRNLIKL